MSHDDAGESEEPERTLKPHQESADDALGRTDDEQFVVDRGRIVWIAKQVAHANQHFPFRAAEAKRQRLIDLHVESSVEAGLRDALPVRRAYPEFSL